MTTLPTDRDATNTIAEHASDHNTLHALNNDLDDHLTVPDPHPGYATDGDVTAAVSALVDAAPATLDTLNELAAALGDDANYAATVTTALAGKAATTHGHAEADVTSLVSDLAGKASSGHTHSGTYVAQSLFDAAGDLLTATANDTPSKLSMGSALQVLRVNAGATALEYADPTGGSVLGDYGDGSDGVVNFDGSTTVLGLAPSSSVYTLTRDIFLASGSQVSGSAVIKCANFRIFCNGTFTIGASAVIQNDGNAAVGTTGGTATGAGTLVANMPGGSGAAGTTGAAGQSQTQALGGAAGQAGASSGSGSGGGATSAVNPPPATSSLPRAVTLAHVIASTGATRWSGGSSGAGGNAAASSTGGGGGASGSVLEMWVYDLVASGLIRTAGGAGGAGTGAGTGAGGGGGGGGGALILVYHTKSGAGSTFTAATNTPGGAGGARQGAGGNGVVGSNGRVFEIVH